jgi:CO dehydrogenase/acetyl-CoA synthase delta subunit
MKRLKLAGTLLHHANLGAAKYYNSNILSWHKWPLRPPWRKDLNKYIEEDISKIIMDPQVDSVLKIYRVGEVTRYMLP